MTKIKKLSVVLLGLVLISLTLTWVGQKERIVSVDKHLFSIQDTTQISGIVIQSKDKEISIQKAKENWEINSQYKADPQLIYLSQRILNAVQTQRPVSQSNVEVIKKELLESGRKVEVQIEGGENKRFIAGGNAAKTMAYFGNEDLSKIYTVAIPGYKSYLSGIFELTLNQWRDRVLFESSWRTIQNFTVDYANEGKTDLNIYFDNQFLKVDEVSELDTAALINYLKPFEFFQLNDYLNPGSFPLYDSLLDIEPLAFITLKDINTEKNCQLKVYPKIPGERFYLLIDESGEMMVVDQGRMENILLSPEQFQKE